MNKSEEMRRLARQGMPVTEIALQMDVRYQFVRNVLQAAGLLDQAKSNALVGAGAAGTPSRVGTSRPQKPPLTIEVLTAGGFEPAGSWILADGRVALSRPAPKDRGVYSFVRDGVALYVGLATMGLAKRLYFYGRPGATQRTSIRVNALIKEQLERGAAIDVYIATPADLELNGLPISGLAGLELGLIEAFSLPWNIRGVIA